ncbi:hypothetical protein Gohar_019568 [Gossypium harknessii]|uniref:Uncharacterized protein n=1 Tax=Gossypium harknessii TaxID=34285 RepID=A0A7J9I6R2_9ROSI|nr:hypothetical protein [Gossypium harknessii]
MHDELEETGELPNNSAFVVIKETKLGGNIVIPTEIKHCQGHEHCLFFYEKYEGHYNGCGENLEYAYAYACKECNFALEYNCLTLLDKIQHKCDEHSLMLTHSEDNIYSKYHVDTIF